MAKPNKTIDYLYEDPAIPSQKYALVSIVGPHMPQKCDVWGLKVRGTADSLEKAKSMAQKLMKIDNDYDVYTVEVGKFFPLAVEPHQIGAVEYQNNQLNELIKTYLENKEVANEHWNKRKNEMIKEAIREGKSQDELANKPEHPIAVLQRIKNLEESIATTKEQLQSMEEDLNKSHEKFSSYSQEERELANKELQSAIDNNIEANIPKESDLSVDEIRNKLMVELDANQNANTQSAQSEADIDAVLAEIKANEQELDELNQLKSEMDSQRSPAAYNRLIKNIGDIERKIADLKQRLNNASLVNQYINATYTGSQYDYLNEPEPSRYRSA